MNPRPWACHALFLLLGVATVQAQEAGSLAELLARWSDERPQLSEIEAEDLARLPWLDLGMAEGVLGLEREGRLDDWQDLLLVPGMDQPTVDALRSLFQLPAPGRRWEGTLRSELLLRDAEPRRRDEWCLEAEHAQGLLLRNERGELGGSLRLRHESGGRSWMAMAGDFRVTGGWQLGAARSSAGGRSAPVGTPSLPSVRMSRSHSSAPQWRGLALSRTGSASTASFCLGSGAKRGALLVERRADHGVGFRVDAARGARTRTSIWLERRARELFWRGEWTPDAAAFACRARTGPDECGFAVTASPGSMAAARDPLSGRLLDRSHVGWQLHGRRRTGQASLLLLHRQLRRAGEVEGLSLLEASHGGRRRWAFRLRHVQKDSDLPLVSARLRWESGTVPGGGSLRLSTAFESRAGELGRLWSISLLGGGAAAAGGLQLAFSDGERSILHVATATGAVPRPRWLKPGAVLATLGLRLAKGPVRLSAWGGALAEPASPAWALEGGLELFLRSSGG